MWNDKFHLFGLCVCFKLVTKEWRQNDDFAEVNLQAAFVERKKVQQNCTNVNKSCDCGALSFYFTSSVNAVNSFSSLHIVVFFFSLHSSSAYLPRTKETTREQSMRTNKHKSSELNTNQMNMKRICVFFLFYLMLLLLKCHFGTSCIYKKYENKTVNGAV